MSARPIEIAGNGRRAPARLKVAVACSGLGHVQRGIESWAEDLGQALRRTDVDVTVFGGASGGDTVVLPCLKRTGAGAIRVAQAFRHLGGWRYGLGSAYDVEQTSFALALWRQIRHDVDILHVQDPILATWCERAHRRGLCRAKVVYANGTGDSPERMRRFAHLQLLTREAFDAWQAQKPPGQMVFMVPNFVDAARFSPGDRKAARAALGLPQDRTIVLCCAAIRRFHKRIDYLLAEFAGVLARTHRDVMLVIAGGREADTDELIAEGETRLGERVRFMPNVPHDRMPELYRAADLFVLASLYEMFGIVLLEAMATGLPVVCHDTPGFRSVVGPAGRYSDLSAGGALTAEILELLADDARAALAREARPHIEACYSTAAVVPRIVQMYSSVFSGRADVSGC